jgi:hypothetical protein
MVVNFNATAVLERGTAEFERVRGIGNCLLYYDGGKVVDAWTKS